MQLWDLADADKTIDYSHLPRNLSEKGGCQAMMTGMAHVCLSDSRLGAAIVLPSCMGRDLGSRPPTMLIRKIHDLQNLQLRGNSISYSSALTIVLQAILVYGQEVDHWSGFDSLSEIALLVTKAILHRFARNQFIHQMVYPRGAERWHI